MNTSESAHDNDTVAHQPRGIARTTQILRFLVKYRSAGVFSGLDLDADGAADGETPATEGKPEEFVDDLEALGPTFIKIGQALSTRPDMVPPEYLVALERIQDDVSPMPVEDVRALVEEALAAFPTMPETLQVMLSTEEFNRLRDAVPEKVSEWGLTPSPDLPPGECRVITDKSELDIGCEHRLEQCMTALKETLTPESQGE